MSNYKRKGMASRKPIMKIVAKEVLLITILAVGFISLMTWEFNDVQQQEVQYSFIGIRG